MNMKDCEKQLLMCAFSCLYAQLYTKRTCVIVVLLFKHSAKALPPSTPRLFELASTTVTLLLDFRQWAKMTPPHASSLRPSNPFTSISVMALSRIFLTGIPLKDSK